MKRLLIITVIFAISLFKEGSAQIKVAAERLDSYMPLLNGKRVGIVANQTTICGNEHLVDVLKNKGVDLKYVFAPEHGFRGVADAGESVNDSTDKKTGIKIISLYGNNKKPSDEIMKQLDVMIFDLQDVGVRFYTYISTMHYVMSAAAKNGVKVIILDRPNPNGYYVDGPILDTKHRSFVGIYPIPVVHGMTIGELSYMANDKGWLEEGRKCDLEIILCSGYKHSSLYELPVSPSPNLPDMAAIYLYPTTCLFEGTIASLGRGTEFPFKAYGHPEMKGKSFEFTPAPTKGAKNPPLNGKKCYGVYLGDMPKDEMLNLGFSLKYIVDAYNSMGIGEKFLTSYLELLVGKNGIREMIISGKSADEIAKTWQNDVIKFKEDRKKYLLYEE